MTNVICMLDDFKKESFYGSFAAEFGQKARPLQRERLERGRSTDTRELKAKAFRLMLRSPKKALYIDDKDGVSAEVQTQYKHQHFKKQLCTQTSTH